jgi:hypothetical protein
MQTLNKTACVNVQKSTDSTELLIYFHRVKQWNPFLCRATDYIHKVIFVKSKQHQDDRCEQQIWLPSTGVWDGMGCNIITGVSEDTSYLQFRDRAQRQLVPPQRLYLSLG